MPLGFVENVISYFLFIKDRSYTINTKYTKQTLKNMKTALSKILQDESSIVYTLKTASNQLSENDIRLLIKTRSKFMRLNGANQKTIQLWESEAERQ